MRFISDGENLVVIMMMLMLMTAKYFNLVETK